MCGIHGFIDRLLNDSESHTCIHKMVLSTAHRGPDYTGIHKIPDGYLGHNRLSIIDLNADANQPMIREGYTIVFNGEIYNYKEIRTELLDLGYHCTTESDTEVILLSYKVWGERCVDKFIGMWAFAIFDELTDSLFCSRDRFGIKPFYFIEDSGRFYFASEVKSLKLSPIFSNDLNQEQVHRFVQLSYTSFFDETFYRAVRQLEPASNLILKDGKCIIKKYWNISDQKIQTNDQQATETFKNLIIDALKLHVRSDVPVGATLSGGIDSSAIVTGVLSEGILQDIQTFSVYYEGNDAVDERPFVQSVISAFKEKIHPVFISPDISAVRENLHKITFHNDFPLLGSSLISQYFVMEAIARSGIKVVLSGQGADDYLGGYMQSYYRFYADCIRQLHPITLIQEAKKQFSYQGLSIGKAGSVLMKSIISLLFNESDINKWEYRYGDLYVFNSGNFLNPKIPLQGNRIDNMHKAMMLYTSLPGLLHFEDRNSMAFSIESRVPFLDHRLVEYGFALENHFKIRDGYTKWVLRESMKGILPDMVRLRKDKKGFVTPGEVRWLRNDMADLLDFSQSQIPDLDFKKVKLAVDEFIKGNNQHAKILWRLANLNYWIKNMV